MDLKSLEKGMPFQPIIQPPSLSHLAGIRGDAARPPHLGNPAGRSGLFGHEHRRARPNGPREPSPGSHPWATVVAERLGFDHDAALTLGRAVAGSSAQMKGRALSPNAATR